MNGYRKELKYIVGDDVFADIRNRISPLMRRDEHQKGDCYRIRSVYFDSPAFSCYRENLAGVSPREKYRIRSYDCRDDVIRAEIKIRHRDTISKMSAAIDREVFDGIVSKGRYSALRVLSRLADEERSLTVMGARQDQDTDGYARRVFEKYLARIMNEMYAPVCIVEYERSAYVYDIGNVRVTFDRNVSASAEFDRMFDERLPGRAVLPDNMHILEIKYDEFLPEEIKTVLSGMGLERCNCSKYVLSCGLIST